MNKEASASAEPAAKPDAHWFFALWEQASAWCGSQACRRAAAYTRSMWRWTSAANAASSRSAA